jgi:hypothetical protein
MRYINVSKRVLFSSPINCLNHVSQIVLSGFISVGSDLKVTVQRRWGHMLLETVRVNPDDGGLYSHRTSARRKIGPPVS